MLERGRGGSDGSSGQSWLGSALEIWALAFMVDFRLRIGRVGLRAKLREEAGSLVVNWQVTLGPGQGGPSQTQPWSHL